MKTFKSSGEYEKAMEDILALMNKGEANLSKTESNRLRSLALAAQAYERNIYKIPAPTTVVEMIELRMYELKLKQNELAKLMGITEPKLSQILSGKRHPDVQFLKSAYQKLHIDPGFLLERA
jgi:antitoxin component HigA of HigAB toxin-antitoxin module